MSETTVDVKQSSLNYAVASSAGLNFSEFSVCITMQTLSQLKHHSVEQDS